MFTYGRMSEVDCSDLKFVNEKMFSHFLTEGGDIWALSKD